MVKRIISGNGSGLAATMRDVAEMVGVSQATVSYVLNAKRNARVSPETRKRVLDAAASLHYRPNAIARAMASGRSRTIGVYQPHVVESALAGMWSTGVTRGIGEALNDRGQQLLLYGYRRTDEPPPSSFMDGRVDGLIILAPHTGDDLPLRLAELSFPIVIIGGPGAPELGFAGFGGDKVLGAPRAREQFDRLGHPPIAPLVRPRFLPQALDPRLRY